jgi:hypothetical protein
MFLNVSGLGAINRNEARTVGSSERSIGGRSPWLEDPAQLLCGDAIVPGCQVAERGEKDWTIKSPGIIDSRA